MTSTASSEAERVLTGMYTAEARYLAAGGPGRASFASLAPFFSTRVALYQADGLPYGGIWRGHEGMERFFVAMSRTWEVFDARARVTGRELDFPILQTIKVEQKKITEVRPFYWDTAAVMRACTKD